MEKQLKRGELIRFDRLKLNRDTARDCLCPTPRFEIDATNDRATCLDCGAVLTPIKALIRIAENDEEMNDNHARRYEQIAQMREEFLILEQQNARLKSEVSAAKSELRQYKQEYQLLQSKTDELKEEIRRLQR